LRKVEEGTYGLSDLSGKAIARERLEAIPEAICTLDEEGELERSGSVTRGSVR
jgi:DnaK suppressor protein